MGNACSRKPNVYEPDTPAPAPVGMLSLRQSHDFGRDTPPVKKTSSGGGMQSVTKTGISQQVIAQRALEGNIRFVGLLGTGAYGRVYKAVWNDAEVAVKIVLQGGKQDQDEATLSQQLRHPNVVGTYIYTVRDSDGDPLENAEPTSVIVMEYCDRGGLRTALEDGLFHPDGSPNLEYIVLTLKDVAAGMGYLHVVGVMHADLNMNNVLLSSRTSSKDPRGFVAKVADFGLSRVFNRWERTSVSTKNYGTITHVPPELLDSGKLNPSGDIYAFGIIMYELYTKEKPYNNLHYGQVVNAVISGERPQLPDTCPSAYRDLAGLCWHANKSKRPKWDTIQAVLSTILTEHTSFEVDNGE